MAHFVQQLRAHLAELKDDPSIPVNQLLLDNCSQVLPRQLTPEESVVLVKDLSSLVPTLPQDPTPLNSLLQSLLDGFSFTDILSLSGDVDFVSGLAVEALPYNRLLLSILRKATLSSADAATVAGRPEIIPALITLWLSTPDSGVAQLAGDVFVDLLAIDHHDSQGGFVKGQGLVWRRVFKDKDVYGLFFSLCTFQATKSNHDLSRNQRTLAQSRLLEVLPRLCSLDWDAVTKSHDPDVEQSFNGPPGTGLLDFACLRMVDTADDILMHKCLYEFYSDLISKVTQRSNTSSRHTSVALDYLVERGIHEKVIDLYVDPNARTRGALEVQFLYSSAANYVGEYASVYPDSFKVDAVAANVLGRLRTALSLSASDWLHRDSPKNDLNVLVRLPRAVLVPTTLSSTRSATDSVISLLPTKQTSPDALNTLAALFGGPNNVESIEYPAESPMMSSIDERSLSEAQNARVLFYLYVNNYNPRFFADLVSHADSVALTEVALAALNLITAIARANWAPLPAESSRTLTEGMFATMLPQPTPAVPTTGAQALLSPPSLEYTLPYLMKPAKSFANLVGGRGDTESVAYKVALAKFEALRTLHGKLQHLAEDEPGQGYEEILDTLRKSLAKGPWSQGGEVGGQIATVEL